MPKPELALRPAGEPEAAKDPALEAVQSHPIEIVRFSANKKIKLVPQPDGSLRATGPNPAGAVYQVVVKTKLPRITGDNSPVNVEQNFYNTLMAVRAVIEQNFEIPKYFAPFVVVFAFHYAVQRRREDVHTAVPFLPTVAGVVIREELLVD